MISWHQYHYAVMDGDKEGAFKHQKSLILE